MDMMDKEKLYIYVGNQIKKFRTERGMTQKELGDKLGIRHTTISDYEKGRIAPKQDVMFALSRVFDVSIDDFFPLNDGSKRLEQALKLSTEDDLSVEDINFLSHLIIQTKKLKGEERQKFLDNIRLAVKFFNKEDE